MINNEDDTFAKVKAEWQGLATLRVVANPMAGSQSNGRILGAYLDQCGIYGTPDEIRVVLDMLERSGLLQTKAISDYIVVALTDEGERDACGKQAVKGVARLILGPF